MRKTLMLLLLAVPTGLAAAGNAVAQDPAAGARAAIDSANAAFTAALNSGKYDDVARFYADDAVVMPPGAPMVKGRAAVQKFWNDMGAYNVTDAKFTTVDLEVQGDIAVETGTYAMNVTPPGATAAMVDSGKYLVVWKRQSDGSWKLYRDMFSSDLAPPSE